MSDVIHEESTTLPEGATIYLAKLKSKRLGHETFFTELRAWQKDTVIKMRVSEVGPSNMRQYLDLMVREIARRRQGYTEKPLAGMATPHDMADFVQEMAYQGMFIFNALSIDPFDNPECAELKQNGKQSEQPKRKQRKTRATKPKRDKGVPETGSTVPGQPGQQDNNAATGCADTPSGRDHQIATRGG